MADYGMYDVLREVYEATSGTHFDLFDEAEERKRNVTDWIVRDSRALKSICT